MREALGPALAAKFKHADDLALDLIATRLPDETTTYRKLQQVVWGIIDTAFSNVVITPGVTRTDDVVWWMRQKVNDLGLGTWFHPSVEVQRKGATDAQLGENPIIQKGDVLHCDFGITAMRLNTDTQHMGYVLLDGETDAPAGLKAALANSNKLQDIVMGEIKPGRTGNEVLASSRAKMTAAGIDGTVYSHPIGLNGHGAGPLIGLWDYQDGVPGRGDAKVIPEHVVLDRAAGDDEGAGVEQPAGAFSAGGGRGRRSRRRDPLGVGAADGVSFGQATLNWSRSRIGTDQTDTERAEDLDKAARDASVASGRL